MSKSFCINITKIVTSNWDRNFLTQSAGVGYWAPLYQMTRITDIITNEPIISIFCGETAGNNAENMIFPMMMSCQHLN